MPHPGSPPGVRPIFKAITRVGVLALARALSCCTWGAVQEARWLAGFFAMMDLSHRCSVNSYITYLPEPSSQLPCEKIA